MAGLNAAERAALKESRREKNREANAERQANGNYSKKDVKAIARKPIATPMGSKQRMQEFREKLLHAPTGESIIRKVLAVALDDEHPGQMSAMKMCLDRMLPTSMFEDKKESGRAAISITISGIGEQTQVIENDVIDAEEVE